MKHVLALTVLLPVLAACGASKDSGVARPTAAEPATTSVSSPPTTSGASSRAAAVHSDNPAEEAKRLASRIPAIAEVVTITEDNDANNLIGRPGQYDAASFMADKRLACNKAGGYDQFSIDCGAKIERWASEADAKTRMKDIQAKLKAYGLGAEWDYVRGRLLLRVADKLKPSEVAPYRTAFLG